MIFKCRKTKCIALILVSGGILAWSGIATAEFVFENETLGKLRLNGFARAQADIRTGRQNPNNSPAFDSRDNVQQIKHWSVFDLDWETPRVPGLEVFLRSRYQWDLTDDRLDGSFNAFPKNGDNATITRTGGTDAILELWEARVDYTIGNWWFRVGRQPIVWGDLAPTRLLDTVNSLDLKFHLFNELGGREAFDNIRIPIWALRSSYALPWTGYSVEGFISPNTFGFIPTQLPDRDSPFNVLGLPPFVNINEDTKKDNVTAGFRLMGEVDLGKSGPLGFSLNWLYRPEGDGVNRVGSVNFNPSRIIPGVGPFGSSLPLGALPGDRVNVSLKHPSFHTVGFSTNYFHAPSKVVVRTEFVWDINRPFDRLALQPDFDGSVNLRLSDRFIRRDQIGYAIALDRPTFLLRKDRAANLTFQVEQRFRPNRPNDAKLGQLGAPVDKTQTNFIVLFSQPWKGFGGRFDEIFTDLTAQYDLGGSNDNGHSGSYFIQPAIRWEPGDRWRWALWYTQFGGGDERPGKFGSLDFASGVNMSLSYQF